MTKVTDSHFNTYYNELNKITKLSIEETTEVEFDAYMELLDKKKRALKEAKEKEKNITLAAMEHLDKKLADNDRFFNEEQMEAYLAQVAEKEGITEEELKKERKRAKKKLEENKQDLKAQEELEKASYARKEKRQLEQERKETAAKKRKETLDKLSNGTLLERGQAVADLFKKDTDGLNGFQDGLKQLTTALSDFTKQLDSQIEGIAKKQSAIDTRLQGSKHATTLGSYQGNISATITGAAAISPLVKQEDIVSNVEAAVKKGIAYNVEQRAFLETIKDKIADTFSAFDGNLARLIRIQDKDSTAARLGMESAMTAFLNNMYETTEYLTDVANSVRSSLQEAEAMMDAEMAVEVEYQVQKQMGSLYSVGMSNTSVGNIASTLGKIISGDISGVTSGGASNLLLMAANSSGISITDALTEGLDASNTNVLLKSTVEFLAKIYESTKDNKILQQQFATVYGISGADLKAAANLLKENSLENTYNSTLTYGGAYSQLTKMANSMWRRTSQGEQASNLTSNFKYSLAANIGSNPLLYGVYEAAKLLDTVAGGINIPAVSVLGNGVDLNATVADLMRVGALGGSALAGLYQVLGSGSAGGLTGGGLLRGFGISSDSSASVQRGTGANTLISSGSTVSMSGGGSTVNNGNLGDLKNKTMTSASDEAKAQSVEQQEEADQTTSKIATIDANILELLNLFKPVVVGDVVQVRVKDYGLTWN